ncbi:MAG: GNAT family N-acetyltransferase [Actinopolymorphaceae bacterium]
MSSIEVRPFRRSDREQLTTLVNRHIQAVIPGMSVSVSTVLNQLEREPGEAIVDPWVSARTTLVAYQHERLVAAAHLRRYADDDRVNVGYRDAGEIRWMVCWPPDFPWNDATAAGDTLAGACHEQFDRWQVSGRSADGSLPAPSIYGVPAQWPHISAIYERAGFVHVGDTEVVLLARVEDIPLAGEPPIAGLTARRSLGINGTRFSAYLGDERVGYIEVENLADAGRVARHDGWADIGNLHILEAYQRQGIATWLFGLVAEWLDLARVDRLLEYANPEQEAELALFRRLGFVELTRTARGFDVKTA